MVVGMVVVPLAALTRVTVIGVDGAVQRVVPVIDDGALAIGDVGRAVCVVEGFQVADVLAHPAVAVLVAAQVVPGQARPVLLRAVLRLVIPIIVVVVQTCVVHGGGCELVPGAVLVHAGGDAGQQVFARAVFADQRVGVIAIVKGVVLVGEVVARSLVTTAAVIAHVAGEGVERVGAHHQRALDRALIDRIVTAVRGALSVGGRLETVVVGGILGDPRRLAVGGVVGEVDGARDGFLGLVGQVLAVDDLLDGRGADGGVGRAGRAVL